MNGLFNKTSTLNSIYSLIDGNYFNASIQKFPTGDFLCIHDNDIEITVRIFYTNHTMEEIINDIFYQGFSIKDKPINNTEIVLKLLSELISNGETKEVIRLLNLGGLINE